MSLSSINYKRLIISLALPQLAGLFGSFFTVSAIPVWYASLERPSFSPPNWIFGPVWITLYALMGIAAYLVWQKKDITGTKKALTFYGAQLALNALWSMLFFGLKNPGVAFIEIIILLILIIKTTMLFWKIDRWAGALMIPYIAWVSFATFLNYTIWQLN